MRPAPSSAAFDAFVCCTQAESQEAFAIRDALEDAGVRCAVSPPGAPPGRQPVMILLLTRNTSESQAIEAEVGRAVYRGFPLVVMRLDNTPPGKRLGYYLTSRPFHRVDAVVPPLQRHLPELTQFVAATLGIAQPPAPAPGAARDASEPIARIAASSRERVGFISYCAHDDDLADADLPGLRGRLHAELQIQFGADIRLWQNKSTIPPGPQWNDALRSAIAESDFLIALVTPRAASSEICGAELDYFLERESVIGRSNLIFPLLIADVPGLGVDEMPGEDRRLRLIRERGWFDWRNLAGLRATSPEVAGRAAQFCGLVANRVAGD